MEKFFRTDNVFFTGVTKLFLLIIVDALFVVCSLPVFTFGVSFSALYYTINKNLKFNRSYTFRTFWEGLKENFKQSTIATLIFILISLILLGDVAAVVTFAQQGVIPGGFEVLFYILLAIVWIYAIWVFSYIAMFKNDLKTIFKNCLRMFVSELPTTLYCALILAFVIVCVYLVYALVLIMPAAGVWLMSMRLQKSYRRYMTDEQRQQEDELNNMKVDDDSKL